LSYRNGIAVRPDPDFHRDIDRLIAGLEDQARGFLTAKGLAVTGVAVAGLIVDADRLGLAAFVAESRSGIEGCATGIAKRHHINSRLSFRPRWRSISQLHISMRVV
jgi:hypothetical protein